MSGDEPESYRRRIGSQDESFEQVRATRDELWRRDVRAGEETDEEAADRQRIRELEAGNYAALTCDRCGERTAHAGVLLVGSAAWILERADAEGWTVSKRWGLKPEPERTGAYSTRVFALCETCHPRELQYGARSVGVEPGYEGAWEKLERWAAGES